MYVICEYRRDCTGLNRKPVCCISMFLMVRSTASLGKGAKPRQNQVYLAAHCCNVTAWIFCFPSWSWLKYIQDTFSLLIASLPDWFPKILSFWSFYILFFNHCPIVTKDFCCEKKLKGNQLLHTFLVPLSNLTLITLVRVYFSLSLFCRDSVLKYPVIHEQAWVVVFCLVLT